jgi:hypothetical protein
MASLITIWWRDIPLQVIARDRREAHKVVLHQRFQVAADRAAIKADKKAASDYVEEMRRSARECGDDLVAEATAEAARLDKAYSRAVLAQLIEAGGIDGTTRPDSEVAG